MTATGEAQGAFPGLRGGTRAGRFTSSDRHEKHDREAEHGDAVRVIIRYTPFHGEGSEMAVKILEAARMDGATLKEEILYVLTPMAIPGMASTVLLNVILAWNEAFWTLNLTAAKAAPLTAFIASYSSPEGLFYAKLSAASTMAIAPILILGWFSQKQLVRGLTFGAVK